MANQPNIPEILSLGQLTEQERISLQNAARKGREELERTIDRIQLDNDAFFAPELRRQVIEIYTTPISSSNTKEGLSDVGGTGKIALAGVAEGALRIFTGDSSKSADIIRQLDTEQSVGFLKKDGLFDQIQHAQSDEEAANLVRGLDADHLLDSHVSSLEARLRDAGIDENTIREIRSKSETFKKSRNVPDNPEEKPKTPKEKKEFDARKKQREIDQKKTEDLRKILRDPKKSKEEKLRAFNTYVSEQRQRNADHLHTILSQKKRFRKVSIFGKAGRNAVIKRGKEIEAKRQAGERTENAAQETASVGELEQIFVPQRMGSLQAQPPSQPSGTAPDTELPGIQNVTAGLGKKAIFSANPGVWATIISVVVIFFLIVVVVAIVIFLNSQVGQSPVQLACGDKAPGDAQGISHQLDFLYHITFDDKEKDATTLGNKTAITVGSQMFNTVCVLFGHGVGSLHIGKDEFNTFGTLTVGTAQERIVDKSALTIHFVLQSDSGKGSCVMDYPYKTDAPDIGSATVLEWIFYNPENCVSSYQFQFRVAQAFGYTLIAQQEHLKAKGYSTNQDSLFSKDFISGPFATGRLPTLRCNNPTWFSASEQNKDCFADMIGEYLTYPYYLDGATKGLLHGAFMAATDPELDIAANAGMGYVINYNFFGDNFSINGKDVLDPTKEVYTRMNNYHIKDILDVWNFDYPKGCNTTSEDVVNFVKQYYQNPNLGGYWIKDDPSCGGAHFKMVHDAIRSIDPDPAHIIMAGFWDICALRDNYIAGMTDVAAFYPYHGYGMCDGKSAEDEIPEMAQFMNKQTSPVPFIGIYQAFWSDNGTGTYHKVGPPAESDILNDVKIFMDSGASGVVAFSVGHPEDVNRDAENDPTGMGKLVNDVRDYLQSR